MSESLDLLITDAKGKKNPIKEPFLLTDEQILKLAKKISNKKQRADYLIKILENAPDNYTLSTEELICLLKKENPLYAFDLANKLARFYITSPVPYWYIAELAIENNAIQIAKDSTEIAKWLSINEHKPCLGKSNKLLKKVSRILKENKIKSCNAIWKEKRIDKYLVLLRILYSHSSDEAYMYCIKLIEDFSEEIENYEKVIEILSIIENNNLFKSLYDFIQDSKVLDSNKKSLISALILTNTLEIKESQSKLLRFKGDEKEETICNFYKCYNFLLEGDKENFINHFESLTSIKALNESETNTLINNSGSMFSAVFLAWVTLTDKTFNHKNIKNEKECAEKFIKKILSRIFRLNNRSFGIELIDKIMTNQSTSELELLPLFITELLISIGETKKAKEILKDLSNNETFRLKAWINRIEGDNNSSEKNLYEYRKNIDKSQTLTTSYKMLYLNYPESVPNSEGEILGLLNNIYEDARITKSKLATKYGINRDTCFENSCNECCSKTYPHISYTEYLLLRKWLDKQPENIRKDILNKSTIIVESFRTKYKKDPPFYNSKKASSSHSFYPKDFTFDCPALTDQGCSVYEAQPFMCRVYGYSSSNKLQFQGCTFFHEQFKYASGLSGVRELIDVYSFVNFMGRTDEALLETKVLAPIPVWFAQNHEETVWKAKLNLLSRGITKPLYDVLTKLYFHLLSKKKRSN